MRSITRFLMFYYGFVGKKLIFLLFLIAAAVGFQCLSISLFLPILQGETINSRITLAIKNAFAFFGIDYTFSNLLLFLVLFFFLRSVFLLAQASLVGRIIADMLVALRRMIAEKIFALDYQAFLKKSSGLLNNALTVEAHQVVFAFKMFTSLLVGIFFAVMYIAISMFLNPVLVLFLVSIGIPFFLIVRYINGLTMKYSTRISDHSAGLQGILIQSIKYFKYLRATSAYPKILRQISHQSNLLAKLRFRLSVLGAVTSFGFEPFVVLITAGVVFYHVELRGQSVIANFFLIYLLYAAMKRVLGIQSNFRKLLSSWGSINVITQLEKELDGQREIVPYAGKFQEVVFDKTIRFKNVSFRFHNGAEVLRDINIEVPANSTVAFVGGSGVGKTTLVNVLIGLLQPAEGEIFIGDIPYRDIHPFLLRRNIGYITQEDVIFNDTIYNNITLWEPERSDKNRKLVESVCEKAHIAEFINSLRYGYDTVLGEGGIDISGGQRQRICIARELFKDTKILIFDEATSSLDTKTEKEIQKNIDEFKGEKTIILVAHRLSTVRNADKIFVLKDNTIVEEGSYDELCTEDSEFKKMVLQQNS